MKTILPKLGILILLFQVLTGCNEETTVSPEVISLKESSLIIVKNESLAKEVRGDEIELVAGERVSFGLKYIYSDLTHEQFPIDRITWEVEAPDELKNYFSIQSNGFRALRTGDYNLVMRISGQISHNSPNIVKKKLKIIPSSPEKVEILSGHNSTAKVTEALSQNLIVRVQDSFDNAVSGVKVTFIAEDGQVQETEVFSDERGLAETSYTLGTRAGEQKIRAEIGNFVKRFSDISIKALPDSPYQLRVEAPHNTVVAGDRFLLPVNVFTEDRYGNKVINDLRQIKISATRDEKCLFNSHRELISTELTKLSSEGLAEFPEVSHTIAENLYIKAESLEGDIKKGCSTPVEVIPSAPNKIIFRVQPIGSLAGKQIEQQPRVDLVDQYDNTVSIGTGKVSVNPYSDINCSIPSLGNLIATNADMFGGSAKFSNVTYSRTDPLFLKADYRFGLERMSACSQEIRLEPNEPAQVGFVDYPTQITAGIDFDVTLKTKDFLGNNSGSYSNKVTLIAYSDPGCRVKSDGEIVLNGFSEEQLPSFSDGSVTISANIKKSGVIFLKATTENFSVCSGLINVKANSPSSISFVNQPGSYNGVIGNFLTTAPKIAVSDRYGNLVTDASGSIGISPYTTEGCTSSEGFSGRFVSAPANIIGGVASFRDISYDKTNIIYLKGSYSYNGQQIEDCSNPVAYNIDPAGIKLSFDQLSETGISGATFSVQPRIKLTDLQGNLINDSVFGQQGARISLSAFTDSSCSDFASAPGKLIAAPAIIANSYAQFVDSYYSLAGRIYLKASLGSKSVCSPPIDIKASNISRLSIASLSSSEEIAGENFSEFFVDIRDRFNNVIGESSGTFTVKAYKNNTCSILSGEVFSGNIVSSSTGVATFSELKYNKNENIYIKAEYQSSDGESFAQSVCSHPIVIKPNIPSGIGIKVEPSKLTVPNQILRTKPVYAILDKFGNTTTTNTVLTLDYYSDSSCESFLGLAPLDVRVVSGVSDPAPVSFILPGEYFIKATVSNFGVEKCFSLDTDSIIVSNPLSVKPERLAISTENILNILIEGGVAPYTCSVDTSVYPQLSEYSSRFLNDCTQYLAGYSDQITEMNPHFERIVFSDQFGQSIYFDLKIGKSMTFNLSRSMMTSFELQEVQVQFATDPNSSFCSIKSEAECTGLCSQEQAHSTVQLCSSNIQENNLSCLANLNEESCVSAGCNWGYPENDVVSNSCVSSRKITSCSESSSIGTTTENCSNIPNNGKFLLMAGNNLTQSVQSDIVSVFNSDIGQNLNISVDVRPNFTISFEGNILMKIPDFACSKAFISNGTGESVVPLNKDVDLDLVSLNSVSGLPSGSFYSEETCSPENKITSIKFLQGKSRMTLYYRPENNKYQTNILSFGGNNPYEKFSAQIVPNAKLNVFPTYNRISLGETHSCGLINGRIRCWGSNEFGQLGYARTAPGSINLPSYIPEDINKFKMISTGQSHTCGIDITGSLFCWGNGAKGRLGNGSSVVQENLVQIDIGTKYSQISAGIDHSCGITSLGVLKCWGSNAKGKLGNGSLIDSPDPIVIDPGISYSQVSAGKNHTCGITVSGRLKCWGQNDNSELGTESTGDKSTPSIVDQGTLYSQVSSGSNHSCGITIGGLLRCWGLNGVVSSSRTPMEVETGKKYLTVQVGKNFTCAIDEFNKISCLGMNTVGQLGNSTKQDSNNFVAVDIDNNYLHLSIAREGTSACAITDEGVLNCWGQSESTSSIFPLAFDPQFSIEVTEYLAVSTMEKNTCAITKENKLKCWGNNEFGQVGIGRKDISKILHPETVDSGSLYREISVGGRHSCGITILNELKCWGFNFFGQLGVGDNLDRDFPVKVGNETYSKVTTGSDHTCAVTTSGGLRCWGRNDFGQVGNGSNVNINSPATVDPVGAYSVVSAGSLHTCAVLRSGTLKCWGKNDPYGVLGIGGNINKNTPTVVDEGVAYLTVSSKYFHSCGITGLGSVKCWGLNRFGQIGNNLMGATESPGLNSALAPVLIDSGTQYSSISTGGSHTCGVTKLNKLKCWGSMNSSLVPAFYDQDGGYSLVSSGNGYDCAISSTGTLSCWGGNEYGQLGIGQIPSAMTPVVVDRSVRAGKNTGIELSGDYLSNGEYLVNPENGAAPISYSITNSIISYKGETPRLTKLGETASIAYYPISKFSVNVTDSLGESQNLTITVLPRDCAEIKLADPSSVSGVYKVKPNISKPSYRVFCDMSSFLGGWTLALKSQQNNSDFNYSSSIWTNSAPLNERNFDLSGEINSKYGSYSDVKFDQMMIVMDGEKRFFTFDKTFNSIEEAMNEAAGNQSIWPNIAGNYRYDFGLNPHTPGSSNVYFWDRPENDSSVKYGTSRNEKGDWLICRNLGINRNISDSSAVKSRIGFQYSKEGEVCGTPGTTEGIGILAPENSAIPRSKEELNSGIYLSATSNGNISFFKKAQVYVKNSTIQPIGTENNPGLSCKRISEERGNGSGYKVWKFGEFGNYTITDVNCSTPNLSYQLTRWFTVRVKIVRRFARDIFVDELRSEIINATPESPGEGWTYLGRINPNDPNGLGSDFQKVDIIQDRGVFGGNISRHPQLNYDENDESYVDYTGTVSYSDSAIPYKEVLLKANDTLLDWDSYYGGNWFNRGINMSLHMFNLSGRFGSVTYGATIPRTNFQRLDVGYQNLFECYTASSNLTGNCSHAMILKMPESNGQIMRFMGISDPESIFDSNTFDNFYRYNVEVWAR